MLDYAKKEGHEQGIQQGIEQGEYKKALDVARELKKEGLAIEFIAKITKLSVKEIDGL